MNDIPLLEYLFSASIASSVHDITVEITSLLDSQSMMSDSDIKSSAGLGELSPLYRPETEPSVAKSDCLQQLYYKGRTNPKTLHFSRLHQFVTKIGHMKMKGI